MCRSALLTVVAFLWLNSSESVDHLNEGCSAAFPLIVMIPQKAKRGPQPRIRGSRPSGASPPNRGIAPYEAGNGAPKLGNGAILDAVFSTATHAVATGRVPPVVCVTTRSECCCNGALTPQELSCVRIASCSLSCAVLLQRGAETIIPFARCVLVRWLWAGSVSSGGHLHSVRRILDVIYFRANEFSTTHFLCRRHVCTGSTGLQTSRYGHGVRNSRHFAVLCYVSLCFAGHCLVRHDHPRGR